MRRFKYQQGAREVLDAIKGRAPHFGHKLAWFFQYGYKPHVYQLAFHTLANDTSHELLRFRMLVAGRRGGKTLSAAWEVAYYCLHPTNFHWDVHKTESDTPLHVWVLVPNFQTAGRAAMRTFEKVLRDAGLVPGQDYKWNRGNNWVEFANGSFLEFKTAEQADNLVGAGIDILWIDEAAVIPTMDAYDYASPALDDKMGIVIGTSTPRGKNWWYDTFWGETAQADENVGTVEYRSCDNPYFPKEAWLYRKATFHPLRFKQEYMAAFDSMAGKALSGEWLQYYTIADLPLKDVNLGHTTPLAGGAGERLRIENLDLDIFIGVDPAISQNLNADRFAVVVLGVAKDRSQVYVLDVIATRIPFPEQVELIQTLHYKWRPMYFGVESVAYQAALVQQIQRLPTIPPVIPVMSRGKKSDRIMAMSPMFKLGRVLIRDEHRDFIDEWVDYDPDLKNPKDDTLDACEIALASAGILLPGMQQDTEERPTGSMDELAARIRKDIASKTAHGPSGVFDEHVGEW